MFYLSPRRVVAASLILLVALPAGLAAGQAATIHDGPLSERRVSYRMDVSLDPATRTVSGTERLTWRNPGNVPVDELQFHLYLNAFQNAKSTFMKESGGQHRGFSSDDPDRWGGVTVNRMRIVDELPADLSNAIPYGGESADLTGRMRFIHPDDGDTDDETVMAVSLPRPVGPGETIVLDIDFASRLPRIVARTGFREDSEGRPFFFVGQWFPKIAVFEVPGQRYVPADAPKGVWNAHQFHENSEFYSDFGTYDVTMRVPSTYVVGASGVNVSTSTEDSLTVLRYRADDVHDFAWTAYEGYVEFTDTWRHVAIRALIRPEHVAQGQRHIDAAVAGLEKYDDWVGEYPYTTLTLVDGIGGSNGMEYPTLITCGTTYKMPTWFRALELVTIHEFGHQYFYGLLASNEFEEAWLDEGMNSYVESRLLDEVYGAGSVIDLPGLTISDRGFQRLAYTKNSPSSGALFTRSWAYRFNEDYGKNSYSKPASVMNTLEGLLGWETMRTFLRTYYSEWRFRHPTTRDLQEVAERVSGQDLDWFFDQFIYGTAVVDYRVADISNVRIEDADSTDTRRFRSRIRVERMEDGTIPIVLRASFADGSSEDILWDGKARWEEFTFDRDSRLVEAYLDPDGHNWIETNRLNNRKTLKPTEMTANREHRKFTVRLQQFFIMLSAIL